jgi:hypothetical protein
MELKITLLNKINQTQINMSFFSYEEVRSKERNGHEHTWGLTVGGVSKR